MKLSLLSFPVIPDIMLRRLKFSDLCAAAADCGLSGLDMMAGEIKLYGAKKVVAGLRSCGLELACLIAHVPMTKYDEKRAAKKIDAAAGLACDCGCRRVMFVPMGQFEAGRLRPRDKEELFAHYARGFALAAEKCAAAGLEACVEDTPTCLLPLSSADECERLLRAVPGLGLVYDTANMLPAGDDPAAFYERLRGRTVRAHLKDAAFADRGQDRCADGRFMHCRAFGEGVVPVKDICRRLEEDGMPSAAIEYTSPAGRRDRAAHTAHIKKFTDYLTGK